VFANPFDQLFRKPFGTSVAPDDFTGRIYDADRLPDDVQHGRQLALAASRSASETPARR